MQEMPINTPGNPAAAQLDGLLTKRQIAERLQVSTRTVDAWMRAKRLAYIKAGKTVRFRWSDCLARLETFRVN